MNKIFVIEGTDGSGKQTQTNLIYKRLLKMERKFSKLPFQTMIIKALVQLKNTYQAILVLIQIVFHPKLLHYFTQ